MIVERKRDDAHEMHATARWQGTYVRYGKGQTARLLENLDAKYKKC